MLSLFGEINRLPDVRGTHRLITIMNKKVMQYAFHGPVAHITDLIPQGTWKQWVRIPPVEWGITCKISGLAPNSPARLGNPNRICPKIKKWIDPGH
jgi:hypothetical protein